MKWKKIVYDLPWKKNVVFWAADDKNGVTHLSDIPPVGEQLSLFEEVK